jgi:DNA polymerase-3 subunit delta
MGVMKVTLTGTNDFARSRELRKLIDEFVASEGGLALEKIDAADTETGRLLDIVASLPFLSSRRMVVLDEPSRNKPVAERIGDIVDAAADSTDLVIVDPKPDKRSSYYKTLQKRTELRVFGEADARDLAGWLAAEAKQRGGSLSRPDAQYLVDRLGANQLMLSNELDKLLLYDPGVTRQSIELLTEPAPQSTIFELLDAAFAGNAARALRIYEEQRSLKVEPQQIVAMLAWHLHVLAAVKAAGRKPPDEIARTSGISPYTVRKTAGIADRLTMADVRGLVARTLRLDVRLKSESIDADDALKHLFLTISRPDRQ